MKGLLNWIIGEPKRKERDPVTLEKVRPAIVPDEQLDRDTTELQTHFIQSLLKFERRDAELKAELARSAMRGHR